MGDPRHVPAGEYAVQVLKHKKLRILLSQKVIFAKDVRSVYRYIKQGIVPVGFVYATDIDSRDLKVRAISIPDTYHSPIFYYLAILSKHENDPFVKRLIGNIKTGKYNFIWKKYGFITIH